MTETVSQEAREAAHPTEPGFYWAKLKTPSGGNFYCAGLPKEMQGIRIEPEMNDDGTCAWASTDWEIVEVWENVVGGYDPNDDESLAVSVPGVPITQWPQDFYWGPRIARFERTIRTPAPADSQEPVPSSGRKLLREARQWCEYARQGSYGHEIDAKLWKDRRDKIDTYLASTTQEPALDLHTLEEVLARIENVCRVNESIANKSPFHDESSRRAVKAFADYIRVETAAIRALKGGA